MHASSFVLRLVVSTILLSAVIGCSAPQAPAPKVEAPAAKPTEAPVKPAAPVAPSASASPSPSPSASPSPAAAAPAPVASLDRVDEAAAKAEGTVSWYTSTPLRRAQDIAAAFEKKYGFKVELFRTGGTQVIQRFQTEAAAGKIAADLFTASDPGAYNDLARNGKLVRFRPLNSDKVPETSKHPDGFWTAADVTLYAMAYRSDLVAAADVPKKWTDLTDAKYKGKLVHADPSFAGGVLNMVGILSRTFGWSYYEALKKNEMMIVQGSAQEVQTVSSGERSIGAEVFTGDMWDAAQKGIKIGFVFPEEGSFSIASPSAIPVGAPHPNAARLLAEFLISDEIQKTAAGDGIYASRSDMPPPASLPPFSEIKLMAVDFDYVTKNANEIRQKFTEIFS